MKANGRVELFFEGNAVSPGALWESGIKHGSVVDAVVVVTEALTDETIHDAVKMWCKGGSDREAVVARFGEIGDWNVSAVTSMAGLFCEQWDFKFSMRISHAGIPAMSRIWTACFITPCGCCNASSFNQPVEGWNTANVTDMRYMFPQANSFNQPVDPQRPSWLPEEEEDDSY